MAEQYSLFYRYDFRELKVAARLWARIPQLYGKNEGGSVAVHCSVAEMTELLQIARGIRPPCPNCNK